MNKYELIKYAFSKSWITKDRRYYYDTIDKRMVSFSHVVWNLNNPDNLIVSGDRYIWDIHHKDGNSLNDDISNLEKVSHKKHTSNHHKNKTISEEQKRFFSENYSGKNANNFGKSMTQEQKDKISKIRIEKGLAKGKNNGMYGKKHSKETREKISKAVILKKYKNTKS